MAATNQIEQRKLALVKQLEESRSSILGAKLLIDEQFSSKKSALQEALNVPKRVKNSFMIQPLKTSIIAVSSGLAASLFLRGRNKRKKKHPKLAKAAKQSVSTALTLAVLRPILQRAALHFYHEWLDKKEQQRAKELSFQKRQEML
ncbi:hypothetical protein [Rubritalea sp.]|uniref:hypothetical protein n=1 Tax=Rubritalea sp. TaxID=2109375 RepID=UPI003EF811B8